MCLKHKKTVIKCATSFTTALIIPTVLYLGSKFHNDLSWKIVALSVIVSALFYGEALYTEVYSEHISLTSN